MVSGLWAIARVTILQIMRRVSALAIIVILGAGAVFLALNVEGDSTLTGQLKVLLRWSQTFMSFALMFLTVYLSSTALTNEFRDKQMFMLDVKPVRRWQILIGKWLGVSAVIIWLQLLISTIILCSMTFTVVQAAKSLGSETSEEKIFDIDRAHREVFVSRQSVRPTIANFESRVSKRIETLLAQDSITKEEAQSPELREWVEQGISLKLMTLKPQDSQELLFNNLAKPLSDDVDIVVRYKFYGRSRAHEVKFLSHDWSFTNNSSGQSKSMRQRSREGQVNEIVQKSSILGSDGSLKVTITNLAKAPRDNNQDGVSLVIPALDGVEVLVPTGGFLANFIRGQLLLTIRLLMLALIGVSLSPLLRGQVVAFTLIGLLVAGSLNSFIYEASHHEVMNFAQVQEKIRNKNEADSQSKLGKILTNNVIGFGLAILPNFKNSDPTEDWSVGREVPLSNVFWQFFTDLCLRGGLMLVLGIYMFEKRETGIPVFD